MDLIVYHNNCPDGFAAAYIAKQRYPEAQLMPRDHGVPINVEQFRDKDVLCVDCNLRGVNDEVASVAKSYLVLDHHKSETEIIGKPYVIYDVTRSGAGLAWDFLFGKDKNHPLINTHPWHYEHGAQPRPWWVDYVEDRDLWKFLLPVSKEVNAYIMTFPYTIEGWSKMTKFEFLEAASAGKYVLLQIEKYVREAVKMAQFGRLSLNGKSYTVAVVNVPYLNTSEVGAALAHSVDIGLGWFEREDGMIQFSARSMGDVDVSEVAKAFGGGGHQHAAGFQVSLDKGREIVDTILSRRKPRYRIALGPFVKDGEIPKESIC